MSEAAPQAGFVDSIGVSALVQPVRSLQSRQCTAVLAAPGQAVAVRRVFDITRLAGVVPVEETRDDAFERHLSPTNPDPAEIR